MFVSYLGFEHLPVCLCLLFCLSLCVSIWFHVLRRVFISRLVCFCFPVCFISHFRTPLSVYCFCLLVCLCLVSYLCMSVSLSLLGFLLSVWFLIFVCLLVCLSVYILPVCLLVIFVRVCLSASIVCASLHVRFIFVRLCLPSLCTGSQRKPRRRPTRPRCICKPRETLFHG